MSLTDPPMMTARHDSGMPRTYDLPLRHDSASPVAAHPRRVGAERSPNLAVRLMGHQASNAGRHSTASASPSSSDPTNAHRRRSSTTLSGGDRPYPKVAGLGRIRLEQSLA
jgi:hypothetical protein